MIDEEKHWLKRLRRTIDEEQRRSEDEAYNDGLEKAWQHVQRSLQAYHSDVLEEFEKRLERLYEDDEAVEEQLEALHSRIEQTKKKNENLKELQQLVENNAERRFEDNKVRSREELEDEEETIRGELN